MARPTDASRSGLTLVELMVVLVILAALMAWIIPAVQASREAARRSQCVCNLKMIGLALYNYLDTHNVFPPGRVNTQVAGQGHCWGTFPQILPFLELKDVFNAINFAHNPDSTTAVANITAATTFLHVLACPSDVAPTLIPVAGRQYATNNYLVNVGSEYAVVQAPPTPMTEPNGMFYENSAVTLSSITDGTTTTAALAETTRSSAGTPARFDALASFRRDPVGGYVTTGENPSGRSSPLTSDADYVRLCQAVPPAGFEATRGVNWLVGAPGNSMYNHRRPPNNGAVDCRGGLAASDQASAGWRNLSLNVTPRSRHPGGVNVLFADAHIHFVKDSVAASVWQHLGSRNVSQAGDDQQY